MGAVHLEEEEKQGNKDTETFVNWVLVSGLMHIQVVSLET